MASSSSTYGSNMAATSMVRRVKRALDSHVEREEMQVSIIVLDYYFNDRVSAGPEIRVFGRERETGESYCVRVSEYYPYFFVKVPLGYSSNVQAFIKEIELTLGRCKSGKNLLKGFTLCSGIDFYGYRYEREIFVKIDIRDPKKLKSAGEKLSRKGWQPYETHIPFLTAFLADYKLSGMGYMCFLPPRRKKTPTKKPRGTDSSESEDEDGQQFAISSSPLSPIKSIYILASDILDNPGFEDECNRQDEENDSNLVPYLSTWIDEARRLRQPNERVTQIDDVVRSASLQSCRSVCTCDTLKKEKLKVWLQTEPRSKEQQNPPPQPRVATANHDDDQSSINSINRDDCSSVDSVDDEDDESLRKQEAEQDIDPVYDIEMTQDNFLKQVAENLSQEQDPSKTKGPVPESFYNLYYFSNPDDAKWEKNNHKVRNEKAKGTLPTPPTAPHAPAKLRNTLSLNSFSPYMNPPTYEEVLESHNSSSAQNRTSDNVEHVDTGSRKIDSTSSIVKFRSMFVEVAGKATAKHRVANPAHDRVIMIYGAVVLYEVYESSFIIRMDPENPDAEDDERRMLLEFVRYVREYDPDAICGWEVQRKSIGYLFDRASVLGIPKFVERLGRLDAKDARHLKDAYNEAASSEFFIIGRLVLNIWRIVRKEIKLPNYRLETVVLELFQEPIPKYRSNVQYTLFQDSIVSLIDHLRAVVDKTIGIVNHLDVITKAGENAKLLGVDLFSTFTRGSQYRVEGVMIRITRALDYVLPCPNRMQVRTQDPLKVISLTLDPCSNFYPDPVAVLDFRSLYPSLIIAYNLCFSTYVGTLEANGEFRYETGVFSHFRNDRGVYPTQEHLRQLLEGNQLLITSAGQVFVKSDTRRGVLPIMLDEILKARIEIKDALNTCKKGGHAEWSRVLDARQYALKMLANVTYGYTAASFSGRMPLSSLADSIVLLGKESLEKAIEEAHSQAVPPGVRHLPRVVYGDTDSLFVHFKNWSLAQAFNCANHIARQVSASNPYPMKLQMEKVYKPSFLVSKKRYVGYKYTSQNDQNPKIDSKGLENIRRDSCGIMKTVMNDMLLTIFTQKDLSILKRVFIDRMQDILQNRVNVKEFVFASKVRVPLERYKGNLPPSARVASELLKNGEVTKLIHKERIEYIITKGELGQQRMCNLVASPGPFSEINAEYYINHKLLNPLNRVFRLARVDVKSWYRQLRLTGSLGRSYISSGNPRGGIFQSFNLTYCKCYACGNGFSHRKSGDDEEDPCMCDKCSKSFTDQESRMLIAVKNKQKEQRMLKIQQQCRICTLATSKTFDIGEDCVNTNCPIFYLKDW